MYDLPPMHILVVTVRYDPALQNREFHSFAQSKHTLWVHQHLSTASASTHNLCFEPKNKKNI